MLIIWKRLWAMPWTACGLAIGIAAMATGGMMCRRSGTLAFTGGVARTFLRTFPLVRGASAMTLGHVILAQSPADLELSYEHELRHVRQYERWGPLFVPAYLAASLWQKLHGRHPYWDNPFEREAYDD
jgi:hypothetical protein